MGLYLWSVAQWNHHLSTLIYWLLMNLLPNPLCPSIHYSSLILNYTAPVVAPEGPKALYVPMMKNNHSNHLPQMEILSHHQTAKKSKHKNIPQTFWWSTSHTNSNSNSNSDQQTSTKGGETEESRKSSKCHPGSVSIKYSDMLLADPPPPVAIWPPPPLFTTAAGVMFVGALTQTFGVHIVGALETAATFLTDPFDLDAETTQPPLPIGFSPDGDGAYRAALAESLIPVKRNLSCFLVSSLAEWIGSSHSLHRIALSCWQNKNPRRSYKTRFKSPT